MNSDHQTISMRQTYRLFLFDFLGISTLLLPPVLSGATGVYGGISIAAAGILGALYLSYLVWTRRKIGTDLITFLSGERFAVVKKAISAALFLTHTVSAGVAAALLSGMVKKSLIREESYALILLLLLFAAAYTAGGSLPARARVYEILFWFVIAPLLLMLLLAAKEIDPAYYTLQRELTFAKTAGSAYQVFVCCGALFTVLFFPHGEAKKTGRCVLFALLTALFILLGAYYLMLGVFGEAALAALEYPVVTLMSMIQFKGGFLKRLDAIMLGVWFFTLSALLTMNLYYGRRLLCAAVGSGKKRETVCCVCVLLLTFLTGLLLGYEEDAQTYFADFFRYVRMPLYLLVPGACALLAKNQRSDNK